MRWCVVAWCDPRLFYKSAGPFFRRLVPEPYEAICELARSRYMTLPGLDELSEQEYRMLATRAMQDSITHVPNRLGRTPLHVCADPPYSKLHPEHQAVITCLVDEFGVEARLKDMYGGGCVCAVACRVFPHLTLVWSATDITRWRASCVEAKVWNTSSAATTTNSGTPASRRTSLCLMREARRLHGASSSRSQTTTQLVEPGSSGSRIPPPLVLVGVQHRRVAQVALR